MMRAISKFLFQPEQYVLVHALIMLRGVSLWLLLILDHASLLQVSWM
jgi:hypothetical protein